MVLLLENTSLRTLPMQTTQLGGSCVLLRVSKRGVVQILRVVYGWTGHRAQPHGGPGGCAGGAAPQLPRGNLDPSRCLWVARIRKAQSISVWVQGLEALLLGKLSSCVSLVACWVHRTQLKTRRVKDKLQSCLKDH